VTGGVGVRSTAHIPFCFSAARRNGLCVRNSVCLYGRAAENKKGEVVGARFYKQATPNGVLNGFRIALLARGRSE
jgi:hypothetical protein